MYGTNRIFDDTLKLNTSKAITTATTTVMTVASVDLGASGGAYGDWVVQWSGLDVASNDELYETVLQGSDNSDFSTGTEVELARLNLGALEKLASDTDSAATGKEVIPWDNEVAGTKYRYVRMICVSTGTTPAITYEDSFLTIRHR